MFRCYFCQTVTPPKTTRHSVVIESRAKRYSSRRREPKRGFRNRDDAVQDHGGDGIEIMKEVDACPECASKQHEMKTVALAPAPSAESTESN